MQRRVSAFKNYTIEAPDGKVGHISDVLFEDNNWKIRWFVVNTGPWLLGRKLLIHPKALGRPDIRQRAFAVSLTKAEVETSPDISTDPPVFLQMEQVQPAYYAYTPNWNGGDYNGNGSAGARATSPYLDGWQSQGGEQPGDPHLRSLGEVVGYHIQALDGDIGHLEDFLVDDETWTIEYAVVDTKNWGFGNHVLVPPTEVKSIDWAERHISLQLTRYNIRSGPSWQEPNWSDRPG